MAADPTIARDASSPGADPGTGPAVLERARAAPAHGVAAAPVAIPDPGAVADTAAAPGTATAPGTIVAPEAPTRIAGPGASPAERADALTDWLVREAVRLDPDDLLAALAARLNAVGIPVHRIMVPVESAFALHQGFSRIWSDRDGGRLRYFPHGARDTDAYRRSPFHTAYTTGRWVLLDPLATPVDAYNVIEDLRAGGYRHYLAAPLAFSDGRPSGLSLASREPDAFDATAREVVARVLPALGAVLELFVERWRLATTLRTYVGRTPAKRILAGTVRRGDVVRIEAAIMFVDMRDFTALTAHRTPEETVELLDGFHDCLVPNIREYGGEVLKFMGDGLLATFRVDAEAAATRARPDNDEIGANATARDAAFGALMAAREALDCIRAFRPFRAMDRPIEAGFALHHGVTAYGNVGSEDRLDFTVVGSDVNLASRVARLNRQLAEPILMSDPFVAWGRFAGGQTESLGDHAVAGVREPVRVHRPR